MTFRPLGSILHSFVLCACRFASKSDDLLILICYRRNSDCTPALAATYIMVLTFGLCRCRVCVVPSRFKVFHPQADTAADTADTNASAHTMYKHIHRHTDTCTKDTRQDTGHIQRFIHWRRHRHDKDGFGEASGPRANAAGGGKINATRAAAIRPSVLGPSSYC